VQLNWTELAEEDLTDIEAYIAKDNSQVVAFDVVFKIINTTERLLREHPESGRLGRLGSTRELVIDGTPYLTIYRVTEAVEVLRVLHGSQQCPPDDE